MDKTLNEGTLTPEQCARKVTLLEGSALLLYWDQIWSDLEKIPHIWSRHWTKESIETSVFAGQMQVWAVGPPGLFNCIVFTTVMVYPAGRILQGVFMFGNDLENSLPILFATFQKFAMFQKCKELEVCGREGWGPTLAEFGFKRYQSVFVAPVPNMQVQ